MMQLAQQVELVQWLELQTEFEAKREAFAGTPLTTPHAAWLQKALNHQAWELARLAQKGGNGS